jgi:hypothetical protein
MAGYAWSWLSFGVGALTMVLLIGGAFLIMVWYELRQEEATEEGDDLDDGVTIVVQPRQS